MRTNKDFIMSMWGMAEAETLRKAGQDLIEKIDDYPDSNSVIEIIYCDKTGAENRYRVSVKTRTLFKAVADRARYILGSIGK